MRCRRSPPCRRRPQRPAAGRRGSGPWLRCRPGPRAGSRWRRGCAAARPAGCCGSPPSRPGRSPAGPAAANGRVLPPAGPGRQAARVGHQRLVFGPAAQDERQAAGDQGKNQHPARPASSPRSRRLVCASRSARRRASATSRSAAARPAWRNSRSSSFRSASCSPPSPARRSAAPPVQLPRVMSGLVPLAGGADQVAVQRPPLDVLLQPAAQPRPPRSSASWATSTLFSLLVSSRWSASLSSTARHARPRLG